MKKILLVLVHIKGVIEMHIRKKKTNVKPVYGMKDMVVNVLVQEKRNMIIIVKHILIKVVTGG